MLEGLFEYLSTYFYESLLAIITSAVVGIGIAFYIRKLDGKKSENDDKKTLKIIDEYTNRARDIYNKVYRLSDKIPESEDSQLRKINSLLERESNELKRIHDVIFDYKLKLNEITEKNEQRINTTLSHIDWLANKYFKAQLDKEARKPFFKDYRDELSTRRTEFSELS